MNNSKMLAVFSAAIKNEIYIDEILQNAAKLTYLKTPVIRSVKLKNYIEKSPTSFLIFYRTAIFVWPIVQTALNVVRLLSILLKKLGREEKQVPGKIDQIIVDLTQILSERIKLLDEKPTISIGFDDSRNNLNFLDVLTLRDIFQAFSLSQRAMLTLNKNSKIYVIHSFTAFNFFLVLKALDHLKPDEIWYCNHVDRWAVLIDQINRDPLSRNGKNVLIQHGIEDGSLSPPTKIKNLKKIYLFSREQFKYFYGKIVEDDSIEIQVMKSTLNISPIAKEKITVLIVGLFFAYAELEEKIIRLLSTYNGVTLYLKPHPTQETDFYNQFLDTANFIFIKDKKFYPDVDIVLSYNSTLAYEYETMGKKVIFYNSSLEETLKQIQDEIHQRKQGI